MWCPRCKYGSETCKLENVARCPQCGLLFTREGPDHPLEKKPFEAVAKAVTTRKNKLEKDREDWSADPHPKPSNII